jgi:hypothetical protein
MACRNGNPPFELTLSFAATASASALALIGLGV